MTRMHRRMVSKTRIVVLLALCTPCIPGCSDAPAPDSAIAGTIKERRDNYRRIGDAYKALKEAIESGSPDMALLTRATTLIRDTGARQAELFPHGSGQASGANTRARDAVWTQAQVFAQRQEAFIAAADALLATPPEDAGHRFDALTQTCLDCHTDFRAKR